MERFRRMMLAGACALGACKNTAPSAADAGPVANAATSPPAAASSASARQEPLSNGMSLARKKTAIAEQVKAGDPLKVVRSEVKKKDGHDGVEMELESASTKPIVAFSGYVYGFDAVDEPDEIALGGEFTNFISHDPTNVEPGKHFVEWWKSHYKLKSKVALVEVVKVKFADGTSWRRGE